MKKSVPFIFMLTMLAFSFCKQQDNKNACVQILQTNEFGPLQFVIRSMNTGLASGSNQSKETFSFADHEDSNKNTFKEFVLEINTINGTSISLSEAQKSSLYFELQDAFQLIIDGKTYPCVFHHTEFFGSQPSKIQMVLSFELDIPPDIVKAIDIEFRDDVFTQSAIHFPLITPEH